MELSVEMGELTILRKSTYWICAEGKLESFSNVDTPLHDEFHGLPPGGTEVDDLLNWNERFGCTH